MLKRTRSESQNINQFAASVVRQTIEATEPDKQTVSQVKRAMGRRGGLKGAATLNARLSPAQRNAIGAASGTSPMGQ